MIKKIQAWFDPPVFHGDEEQAMLVRLLNANMIFINLYLLLVVISYLAGIRMALGAVIFDAILFFAILLFRRWLFKGWIKAAALGLLIAGYIIVTLVIFSMGTITAPATDTYVLIVILAGVLFRQRGVLAATAAVSLAVLGLILAENAGMLPPPLELEVIPQWLTYTVIFLVAGSLIDYAMQTMRRALVSSKKENEERRQAEAALRISETSLRESNERFNQIANHIQETFWMWDMEKIQLLYVSPACLKLWGLPPDKMYADPSLFYKAILPEDRPIMLAAIEKQGKGIQTEIQYRIQRPDGTIRWVWDRSFCIFDEQGRLVRKAGIVTDLTDVKTVEAELEKLNHELEERVEERTAALKQSEENLRQNRDELYEANQSLARAARMKDEFLASMSHELRTPLTGILGLTEVLQMETFGALTEKQLRALKNIENSGRHLLELINDILDLSKIEANKLDLQFDIYPVQEICVSSLQLTRGMAHQKHQTVDFSSNDPSAAVRADPRRLKQMLVNLLSNAIKFTPEGGSLGLEVDASPADQTLKLTVWDKGIGIAPEDIPQLFKPFVQLDASLSRRYSGTGLGLSLVDRLARLHGGTISVESTPGQGSRFTIALPWPHPEKSVSKMQELQPGTGELRSSTEEARPGPGEFRAAASPRPRERGTILFADDNNVIMTTFSDFLRTNHFKVITVNNGAELVELAPICKPDLILADIQMPGMDGLQAIRQIRAMPEEHMRRVPIIAITALVMPGDEQKCLQAGANLYLIKPIRLGKLLETIEGILRPPQK